MKLTDNDVCAMQQLQAEHTRLLERWKDAPAYSQEVANLHASFKAWDSRVGKLVAEGLFTRILAAHESGVGVDVEPVWSAIADWEVARIALQRRRDSGELMNADFIDAVTKAEERIDAAIRAACSVTVPDAQPRYWCNKCGYSGPLMIHPRPNGTGECGYIGRLDPAGVEGNLND